MASLTSVWASATDEAQIGCCLPAAMSASGPPVSLMNSSSISSSRPALYASWVSARYWLYLGHRPSPLTYGPSHTAILSIDEPAAAASSARAPPDEAPYK